MKIKSFLLGLLAWLTFAAGAQAASIDLSLYFNNNGSASGGCVASTPQGNVQGVDYLLQLTVDDTAGTVSGATLSTCTGTALGAPAPVAGGWQFSSQATYNLLSGQIPLNALPGAPPNGVVVAAAVNGVFTNALGGTGAGGYAPVGLMNTGTSAATPVSVPVNNPWALLLLAGALLAAGMVYRRKAGNLWSLALVAVGMVAASLTATPDAYAQSVSSRGSVQSVNAWSDAQNLHIEIKLNKPARQGVVIGDAFYIGSDVVVTSLATGAELFRTQTGANGLFGLPDNITVPVRITVSGGKLDMDGDPMTQGDQSVSGIDLSTLVDLSGPVPSGGLVITSISTGLAQYAGSDMAAYLAAYATLPASVRDLLASMDNALVPKRLAVKPAAAVRVPLKATTAASLLNQLLLFQGALGGASNVVTELADDGKFNASAEGGGIPAAMADGAATYYAQTNDPSGIADPNLRLCVAATLNIAPDALRPTDLAGLTKLDCAFATIQSLAGLEAATQLNYLFVRDNFISNLTPLSGLSRLRLVDVRNNQITTLQPVRQPRAKPLTMFVADNCLTAPGELMDGGVFEFWHDQRYLKQYNNCLKNSVDLLVFKFTGTPAADGTRTVVYRTTSNPNAVCQIRWGDGASEAADCTGQVHYITHPVQPNQRVDFVLNGEVIGSLVGGTGVPYLDANGTQQMATSVTELTSSTSGITLQSGWYVCPAGTTLNFGGYEVGLSNNYPITVSSDVHLILVDGCNMVVDGFVFVTGSLTIYAQSTNPTTMGSMTANTPSGWINGGISGGSITINGGKISSSGNYCGLGDMEGNRSIVINGGEVQAIKRYSEYTTGEGAAICVMSDASLLISGGKVVATASSFNGAGIGGSLLESNIDNNPVYRDAGTIVITGGEVTAIGASGAGIGGSYDHPSSSITITGNAKVTVKGGKGNGGGGSAGIGSGGTSNTAPVSAGTITISGNATVNATGGSDQTIGSDYFGPGAGIGQGGYKGGAGTGFFISWGNPTVNGKTIEP